MTEEEYTIEKSDPKEPAEERTKGALDIAAEAAKNMYDSFADLFRKHGLSMDMEIDDDDAMKLASALIIGGETLDECLEYLASKYGSEYIGQDSV